MGFLIPMAEAMLPSIAGGLAGGAMSMLSGNGLTGAGEGAMAGSNTSLEGMLGANNTFQTGLMGQEMGAQDQLDLQATAFDEAMDQQSETPWTEVATHAATLEKILDLGSTNPPRPATPERVLPDVHLDHSTERNPLE